MKRPVRRTSRRRCNRDAAKDGPGYSRARCGVLMPDTTRCAASERDARRLSPAEPSSLIGYHAATDWRCLLYRQDGVWNGERILPEGFATFVSTVAPASAADGRPLYGAFFWINGDNAFPVPREAYYMSGAGGRTVLIVPSRGLVVVHRSLQRRAAWHRSVSKSACDPDGCRAAGEGTDVSQAQRLRRSALRGRGNGESRHAC